MSTNRATLEAGEGVVVFGGSIERRDVVPLCAGARPLLVDLLAHGSEPVLCDVRTLRADLAAVDVLAHVALTAHRLGRKVRLRDVPPALRELLVLAGLADVLADPDPRGSGVDSGR